MQSNSPKPPNDTSSPAFEWEKSSSSSKVRLTRNQLTAVIASLILIITAIIVILIKSPSSIVDILNTLKSPQDHAQAETKTESTPPEKQSEPTQSSESIDQATSQHTPANPTQTPPPSMPTIVNNIQNNIYNQNPALPQQIPQQQAPAAPHQPATLIRSAPADKGHNGCEPKGKPLWDGDWYGFINGFSGNSFNFDLTCYNKPGKPFNDCGNLRSIKISAPEDLSQFQRQNLVVGIRIANGVATHIWEESVCSTDCAPTKPTCP